PRAVVAAVQHEHRHPTFHREAYAGRADRAGATDVKHAESRAVVLHHRKEPSFWGVGLSDPAGVPVLEAVLDDGDQDVLRAYAGLPEPLDDGLVEALLGRDWIAGAEGGAVA